MGKNTKDNFIIVLLVLLVIGIVGFIFFYLKKSDTDSFSSSYSIDSTLLDSYAKFPNGKAMTFAIIRNPSINSANKYIYIDDFKLITSSKLKEVGYIVNFTSDNKVLEISSYDNAYNCKIARFSSVNPYILTEKQSTELSNIYEKLIEEECAKQGIAKGSDTYYDVYFDIYTKIDPSTSNISEFYSKYKINKFASFSSFPHDVMQNAWNLLGVNISEFQYNSTSITGNVSRTMYKGNGKEANSYTITNIDGYSFAGLFLQLETFNDNTDDASDYYVTFCPYSSEN